jgi:hypothetical protein
MSQAAREAAPRIGRNNKLDGAQPGLPLEIDAAATGHPLDIVEIMPSQNIGLID